MKWQKNKNLQLELKISDGNFCTCYDFSFCAQEASSWNQIISKRFGEKWWGSFNFFFHFHLSVLTLRYSLRYTINYPIFFRFYLYIKIWEWIVLILFLNYSVRTLYSSSSVWFIPLSVVFSRQWCQFVIKQSNRILTTN